MNYHKASFEILTEGIVASYDAGQHPSVASSPVSQGWILTPGVDPELSETGVYPDPTTWWGPPQKITASDAAASDLFGETIAMDGDVLVVGAANDDDGVL